MNQNSKLLYSSVRFDREERIFNEQSKSASEAIGQLEDGMTIGIGGWVPDESP